MLDIVLKLASIVSAVVNVITKAAEVWQKINIKKATATPKFKLLFDKSPMIKADR